VAAARRASQGRPAGSGSPTQAGSRGASSGAVDLAAIQVAAGRLQTVVRRTPLLPIELSAREGRCFLKLESMQTTGAFKFRGAYNALSALGPAERRYGVVAASTGNHAIGVARAALMLGLPATILMPATAPPVKQALVAEAGADLRLYPGGIDEATDEARHVAAMSSRTFVSSYDDPLVIAGQGTIAIEVIEQLADRHELDGTSPTFLVPVGGVGSALRRGRVLVVPRAHVFQRRSASSLPGGRIASAFSNWRIASQSSS